MDGLGAARCAVLRIFALKLVLKRVQQLNIFLKFIVSKIGQQFNHGVLLWLRNDPSKVASLTELHNLNLIESEDCCRFSVVFEVQCIILRLIHLLDLGHLLGLEERNGLICALI